MNRKLDYKPISNRVLINDVQSNNSTAVLYFYDMTCKVINDVIQNKFRSLYKLRWDIYNDAYIELQVENWKILSDLKHEKNLKSYLYVILYRYILNHYCKKSKDCADLTDLLAETVRDFLSPPADAQLDLKILKTRLLKEIEHLNFLDQKLMYGLLQGLSDEMLAERLGCSIDAMRIRKHRVRTILKSQINLNNYGLEVHNSGKHGSPRHRKSSERRA